MKIRTWLPTILIIAGLVILAIGVWQITNVNMKTNETLSKAKNMFAEKKAIAQNSDTKNVQQVDSKPPQIGDAIGILEIPRVKARSWQLLKEPTQMTLKRVWAIIKDPLYRPRMGKLFYLDIEILFFKS
jgi:sortase A